MVVINNIDPIDDDAYDIVEELEGGDFDYFECPDDLASLKYGSFVVHF